VFGRIVQEVQSLVVMANAMVVVQTRRLEVAETISVHRVAKANNRA
jgi:hypothetical protein